MRATPKSNNSLFLRFIRCESGATAIEYALIAAGISVAISAVVITLGSEVHNDFMEVESIVR